MRFIIQSDAADPAALDARLEAFLTSFVSTVLRPMTSEAFAAQRAAVIANMLEKANTVMEASLRHWGEIRTRTNQFHRRAKLAAAIDQVSHDAVITMFQTFVLEVAPETTSRRCKFSCQTYGASHHKPLVEDEEVETGTGSSPRKPLVLIDDLTAFKASMPRYAAEGTWCKDMFGTCTSSD